MDSRKGAFRIELTLDESEKRRYNFLAKSVEDFFHSMVKTATNVKDDKGVFPHPTVLKTAITPPEWMRNESVGPIAELAAARVGKTASTSKAFHIPIEIPPNGIEFSKMEPLVGIPYLGIVRYRPNTIFSTVVWDSSDELGSEVKVKRCRIERVGDNIFLVVDISNECRPDKRNIVTMRRKA